MMTMKDNSGKILLAMLAGASAGVIAGLLMAPDTGEATRVSVKKWAGKVSKDLEKNLQASLDEIKKMSGDAFSKAGGGADSGSSDHGSTGSAADGSSSGTATSSGSTSGGSTTGGTGATTGTRGGATGGSTSGGTGTTGSTTSGGGATTGGGASGSTGGNA